MPELTRQKQITFAEMRGAGVRGTTTKFCELIHIGVAKAGLLSSNRTPPVRTCPHSKAVQRPLGGFVFLSDRDRLPRESIHYLSRFTVFQPFGLQPVRLSDCIGVENSPE
jgi:hypothetical protein